MKKLFVALSALCLFTVSAHAQSGFGLKGGLNLTSITTDAGSLKNNIVESYKTNTGYVFGVWGRLGKTVYLQPELVIASKGGEVELVPPGGGTPELVKIKYTDLDVPLMIGFRPVNFLRIMGGPVASFKLSEDQKLLDALKNYTGNPNAAIADASYGYQVGIGVKVLGIDIDLRRQGSLSDISGLNFPNEPKFNQRSSGWQVTAAFKLL